MNWEDLRVGAAYAINQGRRHRYVFYALIHRLERDAALIEAIDLERGRFYDLTYNVRLYPGTDRTVRAKPIDLGEWLTAKLACF